MPKLNDLISKCDDSEMFIQNLSDNTTYSEVKGGNGKITFLTDPQIVMDKLNGKENKIGFVIWLPADVFQR